MKVQLKNRLASPTGNFAPGAVVDLPEKEALLLVSSGQAKATEPETIEAAVEVPAAKVEKAVAVDSVKRRGRLA